MAQPKLGPTARSGQRNQRPANVARPSGGAPAGLAGQARSGGMKPLDPNSGSVNLRGAAQ